jgi:hypothetical protein
VQGHQAVANGGDFEKDPFGTLERLITQKLLDVAKRVAKEELESEKWLLLGVRSDQTVILTTIGSATVYPDPLRQVSYVDSETNKRIVFLTSNFDLAALTITQIYKPRWQVELFFRWMKQHLRIKAFTAPPRTPRRLKSGSRSQSTCSLPSFASAWDSKPRFTRFYRPQHHAFRENAHFTGTSSVRCPKRFAQPRQSIDSIRLLNRTAVAPHVSVSP